MKKNKRKSFFLKLSAIFLVLILITYGVNNHLLPWFVSSPEEIVPNLIGLTNEEAIIKLNELGLQPIVADTIYNEKYDVGNVILQKPSEGQVVKEGRRVYLFISGGKQIISVPLLKGKSLRDAKFTLERIGLNIGEITNIPSNNPRDMIFDQEFVEGTPLKRGDSVGVTLTIGRLFSKVIIPDFIGKSLSEAKEILADSSLRVGTITFKISTTLLPNTVIDQYPSQGLRVSIGTQIDLFITKSSDNDDEE